MALWSIFLTLILAGGNSAQQQEQGHTPLESYDRLFSAAVEAYYRNDWQGVIINMERALKNQMALRRTKIHCWTHCNNKTRFAISSSGQEFFFDTNFFNTVLRKADCLKECEEDKLGPYSMHQISEELLIEFQKRTPYNYLQMAYFKIKKLDKAVAAAHTFYVVNPEHLEMRQNLEYYKMMAGVKDSDFKDLEAKPHMEAFRTGVRLYTDEQFEPAIEYLENALVEYFKADMECRALCEGPYNFDGYSYMDYNADLFQAITDHYIQVLNCKQNCVIELASRPDRETPIDDFLPAHFDYLQFAYYNSENYSKAIECAKTYLLFHPNDEVMIQNLQYYEAVLGEEQAKPVSHREYIQRYINNSLLEKELLYFANEIFGVTFIDPDKWTPEDVMPVKLKEKQKAERETAARISEEIGNLMKEIEHLVDEKTKESSEIVKMVREGGPLLYNEVKVFMNAKHLNGTQRVALDGVITDKECEELRYLSNAAASTGDGYQGKPSPHTPNERFQGVTVLKALKLSQQGRIPLKTSKLFYDVSEKTRRILESYFRLENPLHFSYTHLVCRTAVEGTQDNRDDLSHSVHVDNCILNSEALECRKEHPAYTERDYSAILYLNHDFEGGDFIFTEIDAKAITATVKPRCGRVVGFSSGAENPHGVQAVTKGQRCAVALWFTLDPRHKERERIAADDLVKMLFGAEEELLHDEEVISRPGPDDHKPTAASATEPTSEPHTQEAAEPDAGVPLEQAEAEGQKTGSDGIPVSDSSTINTSDSSQETTPPVFEQKGSAAQNMPPEKQEL
ncbi:prolyl 3-hydroxylase 1 isoform X1 [Carcharodon carcharias]|uniref:prolyl 3-hydroxylase 1 isoform X1 n=1 Tax=Carcharodon carcharias TaxID=13397 RepID=UPI001B7F4B27|nr:prolyl 3-hydroxylase 1 isoform X1 [Carcharodon carcharias]